MKSVLGLAILLLAVEVIHAQNSPENCYVDSNDLQDLEGPKAKIIKLTVDNPSQQAVYGCELDISFENWNVEKNCNNPKEILFRFIYDVIYTNNCPCGYEKSKIPEPVSDHCDATIAFWPGGSYYPPGKSPRCVPN